MLTDNIIEIFSSIQGEGKYVGCRQVFVRFEGCNLHCSYCDTEKASGKHSVCHAETGAGNRGFMDLPNPLTVDEVASHVNAMLREVPHQAVSFTGGEPLLHAKFIEEIGPMLQVPIMLETNGTLWQEMERLADVASIVSMDIKLPSVTGTEEWDNHSRFLQAARDLDLYIKLVVSAETTDEEFQRAVQLVAMHAPDKLFILQPVTPNEACHAASPERVLYLQNLALQSLDDVRVIPQTHKIMGQM